MDTLQVGAKEKEDIPTAAKRLSRVFLKRFVPVTTWSRTVTRRELLDDAIGGFIVGVMVIPTCLSWASLAGLPLSCGLSGALVASFAYGTFGSCAVLSLGPVAEITTLLISIAGIAPEDREKTYQSLGVQVGILSMALSFMDGGKVIKTVFAKAVGDGYTCAAALLAICVQIKVMFNLHVDISPPPTLLQDVLYYTFLAFKAQATMKSIYCFLLFMIYCTYLIYIKKCGLPLWIPHQLIVVVVSTSLTAFFRLDEKLGLGVVGDIESGLSLPSFPPWKNVIGLGPYTITVTMISFVQMYVIAQRVMPDLDANAELFASGITNFLCNIFSGMPVTNSLSCSSVLLEQHVHTPFTAYVVGSILLVTILFLTKLFFFLPKQALGAIVVSSVWRLLDFSGPFALWRYSRMDAAVWVLTFVLTVFGGITIGVLSGIALSLVLIVLRIARPRAVSVGFNMKTFRYGDLQQDPELLVYPNILMWRFDAPLYFINTGYFEERLVAALKSEVRPIDVVLVTCGKVNDIDAAALATIPTSLETVSRTIKDRPVRIILTDIHGRLEKVLLDSAMLPIYTPEEYDGLSIAEMQKVGKKFPVVFKKLEDAIRFAQKVISEKYGNVDTAPYPNVSFLTDVVVDMTRQMEAQANGSDLTAGAAEEGDDDAVGVYVSPTANTEVTTEQFTELERLKRISKFSPDRELIGVMGVVRHAELTPKQKLKITFWDPELIDAALGGGRGGSNASNASKRTAEQLKPLFDLVAKKRADGVLDDVESWDRARVILESRPRGLKLQIKAVVGLEATSFNDTLALLHGSAVFKDGDSVDSALLIVKWGGVLTQPGVAQAHVLGEKLFARFFAAGDLPLHGLVDFIKSPTIVASDESRVVDTALVVMNALTRQGTPLTKKDVKLDDPLLKTLSGPAKVLLQEEYRYFEALMHISSAAAARHFFHLPGFRQLLLIPELDRPFLMDGFSAGDGAHDVSFTHDSSVAQEMSGAFSLSAGGALHGMHAPLSAALDNEAELDRIESDANYAAHLAAEANENLFYTPLQVLGEVVEKLEVVSMSSLPKELLDFKLSNHETLREMRGRYATLLQNIRGAKRARRADFVARRRAERKVKPAKTGGAGGDSEEDDEEGGVGGGDEFDEDEDSDVEARAAPPGRMLAARRGTSSPARSDPAQREGSVESERVSVAGTSTAGEEEGEDDEDADNHDPVLRELMKDRSDEEDEREDLRDEPSGSFDVSTHTRPPTPPNQNERQQHSDTPPPSASSRARKPSSPTNARGSQQEKRGRRRGESNASDTAAPTRDERRRSHSVPSRPSAATGDAATSTTAARRSLSTPRRESTLSASPLGPHFAKGVTRYDLTDLTKLRDYGSYDSAYNLPLLRSLAATTGLPSLRRFLYAFERFATITACMATVSENILVGVNSSKRFIIGSLVSGKLLRRLQSDFGDIATKDEVQGVKELLEKARALYMSEHSNISEDARSVLRKLRDGMCACCDSTEAEEERARAASEAEREFRLRFPFVNLPNAVTDPRATAAAMRGASPKHGGKGGGGGSSASPKHGSPSSPSDSYTRFYFTSYIHVEGLLQCLYESGTVHGFLRQTKQEEEISMQNYMKHVLFKVFRRRNVSFTDDQALDAFRQLNLIFRSDVPYERQQKELQRGLMKTYHAMYYVSIEVYLSLGDAAVSPKAAGAETGSKNGNVLLLDVPFTGSMFDNETGGSGGLGDPGSYASSSAPPAHSQHEDARAHSSSDGEEGEEASSTDGAVSAASTASPTHLAPPDPQFHSSTDKSHPASGTTSSRMSVDPAGTPDPLPLMNTRVESSSHDDHDGVSGERLRQLSLSFAQVPRFNDSEGAGITSPSLILLRPTTGDGAFTMGASPMGSSGDAMLAATPHSFNSANDLVRNVAQAASTSANISAPASVAAGSASAPSPLRASGQSALAEGTASGLVMAAPASSRSPSEGRHHAHHHGANAHPTSSAAAANASVMGGGVSEDAMNHNTTSTTMGSTKAGGGSTETQISAVVLTTPEEGRKTAQVQEMLYRASTVTPMRRIHEGLSLSDIRQLVTEALGAALSQARPDRIQTQEW